MATFTGDCEVDHDPWMELHYYDITVRLTLENLDDLPSDLDADCGVFDANPGNGEFSIEWSPTNIQIRVAKCGDGNGGDLHMTIPSTPESIASLKTVLRKWAAAWAT